MGAAVSITRLDLTASELRKAASGEKDSAAARRILALALVLDGVDRKTAAETCGMDRQTLRDWVHRYNAAGLVGFAISNRRVLDQNSRRGSKPNWPSLSRPVPTLRCTVSCVGGGSICRLIGQMAVHAGRPWRAREHL
jgi:Winged helix-turn helix